MKYELEAFYMKMPIELKNKIKEQSEIERIPMAVLICDMLETGLIIRPGLKQSALNRLISLQ
jgi:hypothetical protein